MPALIVGLILALVRLGNTQSATPNPFSLCQQPYDIVFVIDGSGSIQWKNTPGVDNWALVKQFLANMASAFPIGTLYTQFGVVVFSDTAQSQFYLNTYNDRYSIQSAVNSINYPGAGTNTSGGLYIMRTEQFASFRGDRPGIQNIAIVITDGESNIDRQRTLIEAQLAKDYGVRIYTIGLTSDVNEAEIRGISSPPQTRDSSYFLVPSFTSLPSMAMVLVNQICYSSSIPCTTVPPRITTTNSEICKCLFIFFKL